MRKVLLLLVVNALAACTSQRAVRTELHFGMNKQSGGEVSDAEWNAFVDTVLVRTFAAGMTVANTGGYWFDPTEQRMESERSHMVIVVHPPGRALDAAIDTARAKYCRYHDQYAVLRVDARVRMR
jgi:hypothetical protein